MAIVQDDKTAETSVIFITVIAIDERFEFKGNKNGAVDCITKAFNDDILRSKIRIFLEIHQ